jgi:hypothetical protein
MNLLGIHLTLMMGPSVTVPVPFALADSLAAVEVTHTDGRPSGFQLAFQVGRAGPLDLLDHALLTNPLLKPFTRVVLVVRFAILPKVLVDGMITQVQLVPSEEPGSSTLHITGEDISLMMDLEEEQSAHPAVPDYAIVLQLVKKYARYGLVPPLPPTNPEPLNPRNPLEERTERPANLTDRAYIEQLARQYGFVFYITPGPAPNVNTVHWGPPERLPVPDGTLSVNMGPATNVESINFRVDSLLREELTFISNGREQTVSEPGAARKAIPLATNVPEAKRKKFLSDADASRVASRAQGQVDQAFDKGVEVTGQLDALRYNGLLTPRTIVGLRGAGMTNDGLYYVKSVTHRISKGRYTQDFQLSREGTGTTTPVLPPS